MLRLVRGCALWKGSLGRSFSLVVGGVEGVSEGASKGPASQPMPTMPALETGTLTPQAKQLPPQVLINCLRNNIFITVSSPPGHLLFKLNAGTAGFHGSQKTTSKAALAMLDVLQQRLAALKIAKIRLNFRGLNSARGVMVGQLRRMGLSISEVIDTTGIPFNGCRPPKARRL